MKNSISHILSFILMILLSFLIIFVVFEISLSKKNILNILNGVNYYTLAQKNIFTKIDDEIVNSEISESYKEYFSIEVIKKDINNILNEEYDISHYNDLDKIINEYSNDEKINQKYTTIVDTIYKKNIFPINEYKLISKLKLNTEQVLFVSIILILLIVFIGSAILIFNKNIYFYKVIILSTSILLLIPSILVRMLNIFKHFIYSNTYYTKFILGIINNITNSLFIIGIILLIVLLVSYFIKNKKILHISKK